MKSPVIPCKKVGTVNALLTGSRSQSLSLKTVCCEEEASCTSYDINVDLVILTLVM